MKQALFFLRISLGSYFFYAGISKILDSAWTAQGFLSGAKTFPGLYNWFASPTNIGWVNFLNEWGLTLVGISLILGIFVRWGSIAGILLMILYYFPTLSFPYAGAHAYIIDDHIIFIFALWTLLASRAGHNWGLDKYINKR